MFQLKNAPYIILLLFLVLCTIGFWSNLLYSKDKSDVNTTKTDLYQWEYFKNEDITENLKNQYTNKNSQVSQLIKKVADRDQLIETKNIENQMLIQHLEDEKLKLNQLSASLSLQEQRVKNLKNQLLYNTQGDIVSFYTLVLLFLVLAIYYLF